LSVAFVVLLSLIDAGMRFVLLISTLLVDATSCSTHINFKVNERYVWNLQNWLI